MPIDNVQQSVIWTRIKLSAQQPSPTQKKKKNPGKEMNANITPYNFVIYMYIFILCLTSKREC